MKAVTHSDDGAAEASVRRLLPVFVSSVVAPSRGTCLFLTGQGNDPRIGQIVQLPVQLNKQPGGLDVYGAQVAGRCRLAQVDHRPGRFGR